MPSEATALSTPSPAVISTGSVIGRKYRIDALLAEGGMGIVYRGWHVVLEQPIAIKVVRPEYAHHPEAIARFLNEARAIAQLRGLHVAHVLDTGRIENGPPYMVLEYLVGHDLRTLLAAEGPMSGERAVDYVLQTCEAVAEAHSVGVIHRDLKPENLFLTHQPDGSELLKVIDFGISKRLNATESRSFTLQGQSLGSPQYMAPEQMSSPDKVDARADVWSLGVVLFELLTGQVPFSGETIPVACVKVLCDAPSSLRDLRPDLPSELEAVVLRCLRKHPDERYASMTELAQALVPFASARCAESLGRVRRILGEAPRSVPARAPFRTLPERSDWVSDSTPVPSVRTSTDVDFRLPSRPLWPAALLFASIASLLIFTRSDPGALWQMTQIAGKRAEAAARFGARTALAFAGQASDYVSSEVHAASDEAVAPLPSPAPPTDSDRELTSAPLGSAAPPPSARPRPSASCASSSCTN
jgi:serine/threonine protein kinase